MFQIMPALAQTVELLRRIHRVLLLLLAKSAVSIPVSITLFDSKVDAGMPSLAAAPDDPDTLPLVWTRAASINSLCVRHGIPFFFKQWGGLNKAAAGNLIDGRRWLEMPSRLESKQTG
jgi:hypothetical protein